MTTRRQVNVGILSTGGSGAPSFAQGPVDLPPTAMEGGKSSMHCLKDIRMQSATMRMSIVYLWGA